MFSGNNYPPQNNLLDDELMAKEWMSDLSGAKRARRWPLNFLQEGYMNEHFLETGRAAKINHQSIWFYAVVGGIELHDEEGFRINKKRKAENKT